MPTQLPTTVEYMGEDIGGVVAVQTGKTAAFAAKDADGNIVDPSLVTTEIVSKDGDVLSYGEVSIADNQIQQVLPAYFPNTESWYNANFYYSGSLLSTIPVYVSISQEVFLLGDYTFSERINILPDIFTSKVTMHHTDNNIVFACLVTTDYEGDASIASHLRLMKKPNAYNDTWEGPYNIATTYDSDLAAMSDSCAISSYDTEVEGSERVALAWVSTIISDIYTGATTNTVNLAYSNDGGITFGTPIVVAQSVNAYGYQNNTGRPEIAYDKNGVLHIAYLYANGEDPPDVQYKYCGESTCSDAYTVNSVPDKVALRIISMDLSDNGGTTNIYIAWIDERDSHTIQIFGYTQGSNDIYMGRVVYNNGTIEVKTDQKANTETSAVFESNSIVVDKELNPVLVWMQVTSSDGSDAIIKIGLVKYLADTESFRNNIIIASEEEYVYPVDLPKVLVDNSNYYHVSYIYHPYVLGNEEPVFGEQRFMYFMGKYVEGSEDTLESVEKSSSTLIEDSLNIETIDHISDYAGRFHILWSYRGAANTYYIEGNIPTSAGN